MTGRYEPTRPHATEGVGPLTVYRAISAPDQPLFQEPMFWARTQWAFNRLMTSRDPVLAATMAGNPQHPSQKVIPKLWAEAAYEHKRLDTAPDKPSRLDSLYAWFDPLEAFLFIDSTPIGSVWRAEVPASVAWAAVDFASFEVVWPAQPTAEEYAKAWTALELGAEQYWSPTGEIRQAEVLVQGAITLVEKVTLRSILEGIDVLEQVPAPAALEPPESERTEGTQTSP